MTKRQDRDAIYVKRLSSAKIGVGRLLQGSRRAIKHSTALYQASIHDAGH
jgi:hypothetical protein